MTPRAFELKKDNSDASTTASGTTSQSNPYRYPIQVVLVNRVFWDPLYQHVAQRYKLEA